MEQLEIREAKAKHSIKKQLMLIFTTSYTIFSLAVGIICLLTMAAITTSEKKQLAEEMVNAINAYLDPGKVLEFAETGQMSPELEKSLKQAGAVLRNFSDFRSVELSIYKPDGSIQKLHEVLPGANDAYIDKLGKEYRFYKGGTEPITTKYRGPNKELYYVYSRPITYIGGNYAYSINVALDMKTDVFNDIGNAFEVLAFVIALTYLVHAVNVRIINNTIVSPLKAITNCAKSFRYNSCSDCVQNLNELGSIDIKADNEISEMHHILVESIRQTVNVIQERDSAKASARSASFQAFKDALTHVGNKADYERKLMHLKELPEYAIVVADVNNLKYINDTYGHQAGDQYLKGCCQLLCDVFKESPVCRTGGDEFVVFLTYESYNLRDALMENLKEKLKIISEDKDAPYWEKYSIAVGMADKKDADSAEKVVILADTRMYKDKQEYKIKVHGHSINSQNINI